MFVMITRKDGKTLRTSASGWTHSECLSWRRAYEDAGYSVTFEYASRKQ